MSTAELELSESDYKGAAGRLFEFKKREGFEPVALHLYRAANGSILFGRVRMHKPNASGGHEKFVRPFWNDGADWKFGEPRQDGGKVLYGLADLSLVPKSLVVLTEGEQKADALTKMGESRFIGITSGGASSAGAADWGPLAGRHVLIWPDHDDPGAKYAEEATEKLRTLGCTIERIDVAAMGLPHKGDVMDWTDAFKTACYRMPTADDVLALPRIKTPDAAPPDEPSDATEWPEPQPLTASIEPIEYPVESLPPCIRAAVDEVCEFVQAPLPLVASSAIAALSLAIQPHADVKRAERLTGPVGLFMLTIADSGERKSTCDGFFMRAIREYETEQVEACKPAQKDHQADIAAWDAKYNGMKERIKGIAKAQKPTAGLEAELRDLEHEKPEPPKIPRLIYADVTPEALAFSLGKQWPSGGVVSAEAGIVFGSHGMGSDSVMRNLAMLNQLWDGNTLQIDRRTSESFAVRGARLTVALQVQEATIRNFFEKSGTLARGMGFWARFLLAWPKSTQGTRLFKEAPESWPYLAMFNQRIEAILRTPTPMDGVGRLQPQLLMLSPDAKAEWVAFHDAVEVQLRDGGELFDVRDVASKAADNTARLAALFHVFSGTTGPIDADSLKQASSIVAWHLSEAKRFFAELVLSDEEINAARLDSWLIEQCRTQRTKTVNKRTAQQFGPLRDGNVLNAALKALEDLDRMRVKKIGKQLVIHANPVLIDGGKK
ncbi:DUF3987 domain-containing protein [Burkholderia sp. Bp9142]|uniref:DUF3987 domain-containing protein n=1 Tax=Burkholderia sp. Bp9142 TaxID=2184573 RepID=UPI001624AA6E|nr:YfjI family protein [Burkholderia sp. Bp9142]